MWQSNHATIESAVQYYERCIQEVVRDGLDITLHSGPPGDEGILNTVKSDRMMSTWDTADLNLMLRKPVTIVVHETITLTHFSYWSRSGHGYIGSETIMRGPQRVHAGSVFIINRAMMSFRTRTKPYTIMYYYSA